MYGKCKKCGTRLKRQNGRAHFAVCPKCGWKRAVSQSLLKMDAKLLRVKTLR